MRKNDEEINADLQYYLERGQIKEFKAICTHEEWLRANELFRQACINVEKEDNKD